MFTFMKLSGVKFPVSTEKDHGGIEIFRDADQVGTVFMEATFRNVKSVFSKRNNLFWIIYGGDTQKFPELLKKLFKIVLQVWNFCPLQSALPLWLDATTLASLPLLQVVSKIFNARW